MSEYIELRDDEPIGAARIAMLQQEAYAQRVSQLKHLLSLEKRLADERVRQAKLAALNISRFQNSAEFPAVSVYDMG